MEPRDRVLGPIASESPERGPDGVGELTVDFGSLVRKLILSEEVIISSNHLREFSILLQKFGYDGVKEMLRSGRVRILRDHAVMAQIGQYGDRLNGPVLPPGSYSFSALTFKDPPGVNYLRRIADVPGLREKQARKIRQLVRKRIMEAPADRGGLAQQQLFARPRGQRLVVEGVDSARD
jgi:hypothetical protein